MLIRRLPFFALAALFFATPATAAGRSEVAALQVALRTKHLYAGTIDGFAGPGTEHAVRRLQRRAGLTVDGVAGPATLAALGRFGRPELGRRELHVGHVGWDVARLQFLLAWHGFPSGRFDGVLGPHTVAALQRFQRWVGLQGDGTAGPATIAALLQPNPTCPIVLAWPLRAPLGDLFGPRGDRFHSGIDLPAARGTPIGASASGRVVWAGFQAGGWGKLVIVTNRDGVQTVYAHLSRIEVRLGERIVVGMHIGLVGATGDARGPHLHFEVRVRGAAVDPLTGLTRS
jgi:murein DD-endopeptidase MepM/ murein hydrolase activator NlpD